MSSPITVEQIKQAVAAKYAQSRLSERAYNDIARLCNRYQTEGKRPLYVYCIATGTKCAMTAKALWNKRIAECKNDIVCLLTTYLSRGFKPAKDVGKIVSITVEPKQYKRKAKKIREPKAIEPKPVVEQIDPYREYKIWLDGEWKYWWNDPHYQKQWKQARENPRKLTLAEWVEILRTTCHRVDIACSGPCNTCPLLFACSCSCKTVVDRGGKKLVIDPDNKTTFDVERADLNNDTQYLAGSRTYFDSLASSKASA